MADIHPFIHTPIVGQPFEVQSWFPTTIIFCLCQAPALKVLVVVHNVGTPAICQHCRKAYVVEGFAVDTKRNTFDPQIRVLPPFGAGA